MANFDISMYYQCTINVLFQFLGPHKACFKRVEYSNPFARSKNKVFFQKLDINLKRNSMISKSASFIDGFSKWFNKFDLKDLINLSS